MSPEAPTIILASQSPRRRELLKRLLPRFEVAIAEVEEALDHAEGGIALARHNALLKARHIAALQPTHWVIGSDTVVECDRQHLGKPESGEQAKAMLRLLSGRKHEVHTAVALCCCQADVEDVAVATSEVGFFQLDEPTLETYVNTLEPQHFAGGYAIQHLLGTLVSGFDGSYSNVVGLPIEPLREMLRRRQLLPLEP